jgi:hypothetical protein
MSDDIDAAVIARMLSGAHYLDEANIRCPACDFDYSHIREVFTRCGNDPHEGGGAYPGTVARGDVDLHERRDALVVVFDGECGHQWEFIIQQHKGVNMLRRRLR